MTLTTGTINSTRQIPLGGLMTVWGGSINSTKQFNLGGGKYLLFFEFNTTGDASGGGVSISQSLSSYIPAGAKVTIIDAECRYSHSGDNPSIYVPIGGFERAIQTTILAGQTTKELSFWLSTAGAVWYLQGRDSCPNNMPVYLGEATSTPNIYFNAGTNTNAAGYYWCLTFLVELK